MVSVFGKVQNVEGTLDAGHLACCDADAELRVECAADHQYPVVATVFGSPLVDGKNAGQLVVGGIDRRDARIASERQRAGAKKVGLDSIKAGLAGIGKLGCVAAVAVGEIARNAAGKLRHMDAHLKVFARFDRQARRHALGNRGFLVPVDRSKKRDRRRAERGNHHHHNHERKSVFRSGLGRAVHSGFTLVEMLVYFTILSVVATGVYTLVDYIQQTNTRIINTVRVTEQADEASAFLRA